MQQALREQSDERAEARVVAFAPRADRRSVRTRRALRRALAEEVCSAGDLSRVTVTAVTERAGVTRRTFYSHFRDETLAELRAPLARLAACHLDDLRSALAKGRPAPGATELLTCVLERADYLRPLLGDGGDPAFAERIKALVHEVIGQRALEGLDLRALGPLFDYYLTFAISAEVGVLLRWLDGGCREGVPTMARLMTALMFVRPGDLYDNPIDLDIPSFALAAMCSEEDN